MSHLESPNNAQNSCLKDGLGRQTLCLCCFSLLNKLSWSCVFMMEHSEGRAYLCCWSVKGSTRHISNAWLSNTFKQTSSFEGSFGWITPHGLKCLNSQNPKSTSGPRPLLNVIPVLYLPKIWNLTCRGPKKNTQQQKTCSPLNVSDQESEVLICSVYLKEKRKEKKKYICCWLLNFLLSELK